MTFALPSCLLFSACECTRKYFSRCKVRYEDSSGLAVTVQTMGMWGSLLLFLQLPFVGGSRAGLGTQLLTPTTPTHPVSAERCLPLPVPGCSFLTQPACGLAGVREGPVCVCLRVCAHTRRDTRQLAPGVYLIVLSVVSL